jgi:hypothetical protein
MIRVLTIIALLSSASASDPSSACKPVKHYGVSGCELLPHETCPPGYRVQSVDPPNPMMKAPSYLMCVAVKARSEKDQPPNAGQRPHR